MKRLVVYLLSGGHVELGWWRGGCHCQVQVPRELGVMLNGDALQPEHLGLVSKKLGAEFNDSACYSVEVLDLIGPELLEKLLQALDEPTPLVGTEVIGASELQEDLFI